MKAAAFLPLILTISSATALANIGGYSHPMESDGKIHLFQPEQAEQVRILREDLRIELGQHRAMVAVTYVMENDGAPRKVKVGFPVENSRESNWEDKNLTFSGLANYRIRLDDQPLETKAVQDDTPPPRFEVKSSKDVYRNSVQGWMVSSLPMSRKARHTVTVEFTTGYEHATIGSSAHWTKYGEVFHYRLSSAAIWRGTIGEGTITLTGSAVNLPSFAILSPKQGFKKEGDSFVWRFMDLEPTLADDLHLQVSLGEQRFRQHDSDGKTSLHYVEIGEAWFAESADYLVKASSTLSSEHSEATRKKLDYSAGMLRDWDSRTAWVEGREDDGIGESVILTLPTPKVLTSLTLANGYQESQELWLANNRIAKLKITLNGEHTFTTPLGDEMGEWVIPLNAYQEPVQTIRMEITEVHRGTQFRDTAISGITLRSKLGKKPTLQPSR